MAYYLYKDRIGEWRWYLLSANRVDKLADSGEGYKNEQDCRHAISLVSTSGQAPVFHKK